MKTVRAKTIFCVISYNFVYLYFRFKFKYHPIEANKRTEEIRAGLKKRLETFVDLLNAGYMENVSLDANAGEDVLKLLDRGRIYLI